MATMNNAPSTQTPERQGNSIRFGSGWARALLSIRRRKIDRIAPKSVVATKNYGGRHDQQMHTTLFNLANPSQGRRGSGRDKKDEERRAYAGGPAAVASGVAVAGTEAQPSVNVGILLDRAPLLKQEAFDNYYNGSDGIWSVIPLTMGNTTELSQAVAVDEIRNRALGSTYNVDFKYGDPSPAGQDYLDTQSWLEYRRVGMFLGERATAQQERGNDILKKEMGRIAGMVKGDVNADSLSRSSQVIFKELVRANQEKADVNAYQEFAFAKTITVRNLQDQKNYLDDVISKIERGISVPQTYPLDILGRRVEIFPPVAAENPRNTPEYRQLITDLAAAKATQFPVMVSHTSNFWDAQAKAVLDLTPQQQRGREIFEKNGREADTLLRTHLEKLIDAAPLRINMTLENLPKALDSDSYKSAFEVTGTTVAGGRGLQKGSEQGGTTSSGSNRAFRMAAEKKFYGITESSSPTESPIYSYVGLQNVDRQAGKGPRDPYTGERYQGQQNTENISHLYGRVTLNLRPSVRGRATMTPDDSIALLGQSSAAVPLRGSGTGVPPQFLAGGGRLVEAAYESAKAGSKKIAVPTQYVETQIFGGVKLSRDVESVSIFVPTFSGDRIRRDLPLGSGNMPRATQSLMDGIGRAKGVFLTTDFAKALTSFVSKAVPVEIISSQTGERVLVKSLADIRRALKDIPEEAQGGWTEAFKSFSIYKAANTPRVVVNRFGGGWTKTLLAIKSGSPVNEVSRTAVSTKNYGGRHDQQMHTTLFNLRNPSQGREGRARDKQDGEIRAKTQPASAIPSFSQLREGGTGGEKKYLGGSTKAYLMIDGNEERWVTKRGASPDHLRSEAYAYDLYRAAGVPVPETRLEETPSGPVLISKFVEGRGLNYLEGKSLSNAIAQIQKHFVVDALLANWDVIGMGLNNIIVGKDGVPYRIDSGGSLAFRARGGAKSFGPIVGEKDSLRVSPDAKEIFGSLTDKQVAQQIINIFQPTDGTKSATQRMAEVPYDKQNSNFDAIRKALGNRISNLTDWATTILQSSESSPSVGG